jgi:methyl-accepting chemotaxis protein
MSSSREYSIGAKVALIVAALVLVYAGTTLASAWRSYQQERQLHELGTYAVDHGIRSLTAYHQLESVDQLVRDAILSGDDGLVVTIEKRLAECRANIDSIEADHHDDPEGETFAALSTQLGALHALANETIAAAHRSSPDAESLVNRYRSAFSATLSALETAKNGQVNQLRTGLSELETSSIRERRQNLVILAASILIASIASVGMIRRAIIRPVRAQAEDLTREADAIEASVQQFKETSGALSEGAAQSAAALETTSAALEQMSGGTKANAERAGAAKAQATEARTAAAQGATRMGELTSAMQSLAKASSDVAAITRDIDHIAFQTNILALNAAVEAARAGEAGAGFAVVADEVRALAQRSAQAARESSTKIDAAITRIQESARLSEDVSQILGGIATQVSSLDELAGQIHEASREQSEGISQIANSVSDLDRLTQRNAALASETSGSANHLSDQTGRLRDLAESFTRLAAGGRRAARAATPTAEPPPAPVRQAAEPAPSRATPPAPTSRATGGEPLRRTSLTPEKEQAFADSFR